MKKGTLIRTNPYLKDPATREKCITRTVESSSAIEGIRGNLTSAKSVGRNSRTGAVKPRKSSVTGKECK